MIFLFFTLLLVSLVIGLRFVVMHSRRESARTAARREQIRQMTATGDANRISRSEMRWTGLDDRQLARYISEVSS